MPGVVVAARDEDEGDKNTPSASNGRPARLTSRRKTESSASETSSSLPKRRKSSRSTKFSNSMKEPRGDSIADLFLSQKKSNDSAKGDGKIQRNVSQSSDSSDDSTQSDEEERQPTSPKPPKSPAVRHTSRRRRVKTEIPVSDESSDESDEDTSDESEDEEDEMKIQRIIASRSEPRRVWRKICEAINTSEIENGSRWFQDDDGSDDDDMFEERFLVKWTGLSFMHCSWELEEDLLEQVEGSKAYLTTFFRKSHNGLLFDADERGDGEFFDPAFVQIDRIIELIDSEPLDRAAVDKMKKNYDEKKEFLVKHGIILEKDHEDYEAGTGRQFLVKWMNTPYSDCTYEFERDLILSDIDYEEHVEAFVKRSKKPTKLEMKKADSACEHEMKRLFKIFRMSDEEKIKRYQNQLESHVFPNGGLLRDYQAEGVSWLMANHVNRRSSILADEMGLGKTIQTAVYVYTVSTAMRKRGPFLIVAPLSTIPHWLREFSGWTNLNTIVYHGSAKDREFIREFEMAFEKDRPHQLGFNQTFLKKCHPKNASRWQRTWMAQVVITTPEMLVTDDFAELTAIQWEIIVVDEAHRLKNHSSKLANNLRDKRFQFNQTLLLTGTPIQNNMNEMWTLLNIVDPKRFPDVNAFLERYGDIKSKERIDELHDRIRPYILRRLKEDVEKSVPPKEETLIEVELTVLQKQYYRALYEKNVQFLHRNQKKALDGPSINNLAMQLRKCCNHPFLLRGVEDEVRAQEAQTDSAQSEGDFLAKASGKLVLLDKLLPRLKKDGHRVLIFSQFKIMLDILEDYLANRSLKAERIDGSITGNKRQMAIDRFQAKEEEGKETSFVMLLSTRAGGVGINLTAADTCIIFDSDWNPQNDLQAQARCHRIGQTKNVKVYRLLSRKTYEMQMFHMSSLKMGLDQAVLQGIENSGSGGGEGTMTKEEVERLLRHGAYDIFNEEKTGNEEAESNNFIEQDIDSILARSKNVVHENTGSKSNAAGGTFSKASFKAPVTTDGADGGLVSGEVDIDDPEFWKKMVGEAQIEDKADLSGKKRKRKHANYSEKDYERKINACLKEDGRQSISAASDIDHASMSSAEAESDAEDASSDDDDDNEFDLTATKNLNNEKLQKMKEQKKKRKKNREKSRWGGKDPKDWEKGDVEKLSKALQMVGYGNASWGEVIEKSEFDKKPVYSSDEVKYMSSTLVLVALREAVDDDAHDNARRANRATEKKQDLQERELNPSTSDDGGVLGASDEKQKTTAEEEQKLIDKSFEKLWQSHAPWATKAIDDLLGFVKVLSPRSKEEIERLSGKKLDSKSSKALSPLAAAFNNNIWPSLRSRGWKDEDVTDKKRPNAITQCYVHKNQTYRSVSEVLDVAPKIHPELANTVETIISSVLKETATPEGSNNETEAIRVDFDKSNVTATSLTNFLKKYGPSQLIADRVKASKVNLPRRLVNSLLLMHAAHSLVAKAEKDSSTAGLSTLNSNARLAKLITLNKRTALPHPLWKPRHDAILIRAIAKHGWIDRESCSKAILKDPTIKWGFPFDDGGLNKPKSGTSQTETTADTSPSEKSSMQQLTEAARRAAAFLNKETELINEVTGLSQNNIVKTYGLVRRGDDESEDGGGNSPAPWIVDENLLREVAKSTGDTSDEDRSPIMTKADEPLPTKKDLIRRARTILTKSSGCSATSNGTTPDKVWTSECNSFCVLDQSNKSNVLLAEMLHGVLKASISKGNMKKMSRKLCSLAVAEAEIRQKALADSDSLSKAVENGDQSLAASEMEKIATHINLVSRNMKPAKSRQAKNVLRVILGMGPLPPKNAADSLFPEEKRKQATIKTSPTEKPKPWKSPSQRDTGQDWQGDHKEFKKVQQKDSATGDVAVNRALAVASLKSKGKPPKLEKDSSGSSLHLTAMETLLLSVICSQGLPVWSKDWMDLVFENGGEMPHAQNSFTISWYTMGRVIEAAAKVWHRAALDKYHASRGRSDLLSPKEQKLQSEAVENLRVDVFMKERAVTEAMEYNSCPDKLAKKSIMIIEALRKRMGPVESNRGTTLMKMMATNKTENGLGPRVLLWCGKELFRWAESLEIVEDGRPLSHTAADFVSDLPNYRDDAALGAAAIFDRKSCRAVFAQIAQQTRLRSIFVKNGDEMSSMVGKAVKNSANKGDVWEKPLWWDSSANSSHDTDLLAGVLDFGYSGFDQMVQSIDSFCKHLEEERKIPNKPGVEMSSPRSTYTRASVQMRVNHLTRELNALEDTADVLQMVSERANRNSSSNVLDDDAASKRRCSGGGVQTGLDAFFKSSSASPKKRKQLSSVEAEDGSDSSIEALENLSANGTGKRKLEAGEEHLDQSSEKKQTDAESDRSSEILELHSSNSGEKKQSEGGDENADPSSPKKKQKS